MKALRDKKRVTVVGLGQTGLASALFLQKKGYEVFVSDVQTSEAIESRARELGRGKIPFELNGHRLDRIGKSDWILISPGVPPTGEICRFAR